MKVKDSVGHGRLPSLGSDASHTQKQKQKTVLNHDTVKLTELAITGSPALSVAPIIDRVKVVEVSLPGEKVMVTDWVLPAAIGMGEEDNVPVYTLPAAEVISILALLKDTVCSP